MVVARMLPDLNWKMLFCSVIYIQFARHAVTQLLNSAYSVQQIVRPAALTVPGHFMSHSMMPFSLVLGHVFESRYR